MANVERIVDRMTSNPASVSFADLLKVCTYYFGEPRTTGGSHAVFVTLWTGDPRVNIQNNHGTAKVYQVRQVVRAIERLESSE